ncbi:hypothetical protein KDW_61610 [Dictyobacter vulcani]|uniref:Uncharacterized protein n=1 Tax=Dictyobacter vulcani TaxID=2607529 RepID=A0A5J4L141_9CHLR|nr:hypothetical protein [Dictyobacter vulcani]GER91999.1 hypothetical protein KDW_61610 [Dictyobacter vulcani]
MPTTPISSVTAQEQLKQHEQKRDQVSQLPKIDELPTAQWQVQGVKEAVAAEKSSRPGYPEAKKEPAAPPVSAPVQKRDEPGVQSASAIALYVHREVINVCL